MRKSILPELRRGKLRALLSSKRMVRLLEAHNGMSGMIVNQSQVTAKGEKREFDGVWVSGLTESASRGLPDVELMGIQPRFDIVNELSMVTDKPIVVDGDTGGTIDQLGHSIRCLEKVGTSALIIEDKIFPKNNSLDFSKAQTLENPEVFARKISEGRKARLSPDFMLIARIEALVSGMPMEDALNRAEHYLKAGADAIVIHSRSKKPDEVFEFSEGYHALCRRIGTERPLIAIPTIYNTVTEDELSEAGFKMTIHANYMLRSAHLAMKAVAESILIHGRSAEIENQCVTLQDLFKFIEGQSD